jgi:formylglycine-generating enzyme required for sulfatase activity
MPRGKFSIAIAWLVLGLIAFHAATEASAQKAEVPAAAAIEKSTQEVALLFQAQYQKAVSNNQKNKLAQQLISVATDTNDDLPGKYALLRAALDLAVSTSNLDLGVTVIKHIDGTFLVDRHGLIVTFLEKLVKAKPAKQVVSEIVDHCLAAQLELIGQDKQIIGYITRYRDVALSVLLPGDQEKEIARVKERSIHAQTTAQAFPDLKADPNNGRANQLVGLHLLTSNDKLPDAIRHFLKSNNDKFRRIAELEQQKPTSFEEQIELAKAWLETENPYATLRVHHWLFLASEHLSEFSGLTLVRNKALLNNLETRVGAVAKSIGMKLTLIPAGEFMMGSPEAERYRDDDETRHLVKISKPFYLGVYEVTQQQYEKVMGARPWQGRDYVKEGADYPAVWVSHDDAVEFCRRLSKQEGVEYRLPTEAEWEYACRAGTTTVFSFGEDEAKLGPYGWYDTNAWAIGEKYAHRVGQKLPNRWGLYDMHGNGWEWCHDWYGPYGSEKVVSDPVGPAQGEPRVLRGGSVWDLASTGRSASRGGSPPDNRNNSYGFRVARTYSSSP